MRAYGYCRVSTASQQLEGVSLNNQDSRIRAWCVANSHELVSLEVETSSGAKAANRPVLQRTMDAVCAEGGILVVYSLSRFSRSVIDTLNLTTQLEKSNAHLASLSESIDTSSAVGRMVFRMLSTLSQFEREMLVERTTNALGHMRRQGVRISGRVPLGYKLADDGVGLVPDANGQAALAKIIELHRAGHRVAAIARQMKDDGYLTSCGGVWRSATVAAILKRQQRLAA
jgi:DNA invertase Pin-like site-specific DNA recombinase